MLVDAIISRRLIDNVSPSPAIRVKATYPVFTSIWIYGVCLFYEDAIIYINTFTIGVVEDSELDVEVVNYGLWCELFPNFLASGNEVAHPVEEVLTLWDYV